MGVNRLVLLLSVWCFSEMLAYSVHRVDNENGQPVNVEIDFYSSYETKQFLEDLKRSSNEKNMLKSSETTESPGNNDSTPLESWSVVWYIASFGGLIVFFLIVSCSEWCCRRAIRNSNQSCAAAAAAAPAATAAVPDTPPPSYDQFAPPSYESICLGRRGCEKSEYDIYVVPVHALGTIMESREAEDAPPSYLSASRFESHQQSRVT